MTVSVDTELALIRALRLTADPPQAWIETAAQIPVTLGDLDELDQLLRGDAFRADFALDPHEAIRKAGLPDSDAVLAAVRDRVG
jgi:hypothetical protein